MSVDKMTVRWFATFACLLTLVAVPTADGLGQEREVDGTDQRMQEGRLVERFLDLATVELNLSVAQREALGGIMEETSQRRRDLGRAQVQLRRDIQRALSDPATESETFARLIERRFELQARGLELQRWQRERIGQALTPRQTLRFMLMQERLAQRVEAMRRGKRP